MSTSPSVRRRLAFAVLLLIAVAGSLCYYGAVGSRDRDSGTPAVAMPAARRNAVPPADPVPPGPVEPDPASPRGRMRTDLGRLFAAVDSYAKVAGEVPLGPSHEDFVAQLLSVGPLPALKACSLTADGQILDAWGRPVFFHPSSSERMQIRSLGPDGQLETWDDIIIMPDGSFMSERELRRLESPGRRFLGSI